jgi:histidinol-phosphatase (PHP family)
MYDYHNHSLWSNDGEQSIDRMVSAAAAKGIREFAITDHDDRLYPDPEFSEEIDISAYTQDLTDAAERWNKPDSPIRFIRGIEIGLQPGETLEIAARDADSYDFDFIIGSVHAAEGAAIDTEAYLAARSFEACVLDYYNSLILCLDNYDNFDVLGHINNIDRYVEKVPDDDLYMEPLDNILRKLIAMGKGIEVNTSSYRKGMGERTTPTLDILKRYKELGGEIVTIGSDAHRPKDVGRNLEKGIELMKAAGFSYLATFRSRKPSFIKLSTI